MAGLIAALFGGRSRPPDPNPLPGIGGYRMPTGRAGESGFPGSTAATRTFRGRNPRVVGLRADSNGGWESGPGSSTTTRQAAYRGDVPGASTANPRSTSTVATPRGRLREQLQDNAPDREHYGGPALHTRPGSNDTAGGNPGAPAKASGGHSVHDTQTPAAGRNDVVLARGVPGSNNVRNRVALRYLATPGGVGTYRSASRPDQGPVSRNGQAGDGTTRPWDTSTEVSVPRRYVYAGGGFGSYTMLRQMPYGGRGDGARGAHLNGQRLYLPNDQATQFWNAGQGDYGQARLAGGRRPVGFTQPSPWSANFYDTQEGLGDASAPSSAPQAPASIYVSPAGGRAGNGTGRTG